MTAGSRCTLRFVSATAVFPAAGTLDVAAAASSGGQQFARASGISGGAHFSAKKLDGEDAWPLLERTGFALALRTGWPTGTVALHPEPSPQDSFQSS